MTSTDAHNGEKSPGSAPDGNARAGAKREAREVKDAMAPLGKPARGYMQVLSLTSVGIEMAVSVVIGLFGGQWLDKRFGTAPLFLVVGLLIGCAAAGKAVWSAVKKADRMVDDPPPPGGKV